MTRTENTTTVQAGDVIRARRLSNRTVGNYVVERVVESLPSFLEVIAHREHGAGKAQYMMFDAATVRVLRSYAR